MRLKPSVAAPISSLETTGQYASRSPRSTRAMAKVRPSSGAATLSDTTHDSRTAATRPATMKNPMMASISPSIMPAFAGSAPAHLRRGGVARADRRGPARPDSNADEREPGERHDGEDDLGPGDLGTGSHGVDETEIDECHDGAEQVRGSRAPHDRPAARREGIHHALATPSSAASTASRASVGGVPRRRTLAYSHTAGS